MGLYFGRVELAFERKQDCWEHEESGSGVSGHCAPRSLLLRVLHVITGIRCAQSRVRRGKS